MPFTLAHLARTGALPISPFGFRSFSGPFEQLGRDAFTALAGRFASAGPLSILSHASHVFLGSTA